MQTLTTEIEKQNHQSFITNNTLLGLAKLQRFGTEKAQVTQKQLQTQLSMILSRIDELAMAVHESKKYEAKYSHSDSISADPPRTETIGNDRSNMTTRTSRKEHRLGNKDLNLFGHTVLTTNQLQDAASCLRSEEVGLVQTKSRMESQQSDEEEEDVSQL